MIDGVTSNLPADLKATLGDATRFTMDIEFNASAQPVRLVNAAEVRARLNAFAQKLGGRRAPCRSTRRPRPRCRP
ncbi:hypothetical protein M8A51_23895 [Schlegelella sp. S2-27]|uniref:Uncharacterized protein n=1 Tax=Caldimonas mangrovi TaxID=2944811 RepID=A0ABT0YV04_9BURK|nr:hypothetical protein [Caldimonas mangrovi]MCM5682585.1 hypothetical protein [Caldimonas mangrovi]